MEHLVSLSGHVDSTLSVLEDLRNELPNEVVLFVRKRIQRLSRNPYSHDSGELFTYFQVASRFLQHCREYWVGKPFSGSVLPQLEDLQNIIETVFSYSGLEYGYLSSDNSAGIERVIQEQIKPRLMIFLDTFEDVKPKMTDPEPFSSPQHVALPTASRSDRSYRKRKKKRANVSRNIKNITREMDKKRQQGLNELAQDMGLDEQ